MNWNTKNLLKKCLTSIYEKTQGINFEIIIVDNASLDGSVEMLKTEFAQCNIVISNTNLGFSKGNNLAIKHAKGKYALFLNPDTELKTNALFGMLRFLEDNPSYGAVGCKLLNEDDSIQFTCAREFPSPFREFCYLAMLDRLFPRATFFSTTEMSYWDHQYSRDIDCLSGACIMTKKEIIDKLAGFNEKYFMYAEDIELCHKIRKAGWLIHYLADEDIYHFSGASTNQRTESSFSTIMQHESNHRFMKDNYGRMQAMQFRCAVLLGSFIRMVVSVLALWSSKIFRKFRKETLAYSFKKYLDLFLWSVRVKPAPLSAELTNAPTMKPT